MLRGIERGQVYTARTAKRGGEEGEQQIKSER